MIAFPHCKINLGLYVTAKRTDGYHNLETVFFPLPVHDILEFVTSPTHQFTTSGLDISGDPANNLCLKAYDILKAIHQELPPLHIHLHKLIPMGAGLGGGSADGAFMLAMLNSYFSLSHTDDELISFALQLGSDCPFFILNRPAYAMGRGEILEPVDLSLSGLYITIVNPGIHVSTREAFEGISPRKAPIDLKTKILETPERWKDWLGNDFETPVSIRFPEIATIKDTLYNAGAVYASMTGSGSTVYGIFREKTVVAFPDTYMVKTVQIK